MTEFNKALIVGGGAMAIEHHVPRVLGILRSQEILIVEINEKRREQLIKKFSFRPNIQIASELPGKSNYDLTIVATPPKFHLELFKRLNEQSAIMLIEKPLAMTYGQCKEFCDIVEKSGTDNVVVGMIRRTLSGYRLVRQIYQSGLFGDLLSVSLYEGCVFGWNAASIGSFSRDLNGGGVLMDTGPHALDLLYQIFDELSLKRAYMDATGEAVEANCTLTMEGDKCVPITFSLSRNRYLSNQISLEFEEAKLSIGVRGNAIQVQKQGHNLYTLLPPNISNVEAPDFSRLIDDFYKNCLVQGSSEGVRVTDACRIHEIIDQAYEKAIFSMEKF